MPSLTAPGLASAQPMLVPKLHAVRSRNVICKLQVRPYTLRRGDTLSSIAEKRDMQLKRLIKLNHEIDPNNVGEGQTIVVPVGKLSDRDRLILDGMGQGRYRTYPIRKGEKLEEVLSKRGISMEEFEKLNPGVNPKKVPENYVVQLPRNKYTAREREMLIGAGAPAEWFVEDWGIFGAGLGVGAAVFAAVSYFLNKAKDD